MSWKLSGIVALGLVLGIVAARLAQDPDTGTASWDGLRAAGFAAYLCLWLGLITGLAVHMRYRPGPLAMTWLLETHRISSTLGLAFVAGHVAGLLVDPTIGFSVVDVSFGLTSSYRPLQVTFGALAMWLMVAVLASTGLSARIPYATWRNLHFLSFPAYGFALLHGITAGTDASSPLALVIYASTASFVAAMLVARVLGRGWVSAGQITPGG
jgi:sulfoxide reductase heme-binding subunit YedZ